MLVNFLSDALDHLLWPVGITKQRINIAINKLKMSALHSLKRLADVGTQALLIKASVHAKEMRLWFA